MIPHIIHYCWFGGRKLPDEVITYMATWRKHFPDFDIKQWDETNFDVNALPYTRQAYFSKKYAFVSDVARLHALTTEGGLYLDTDILIKKNFPSKWFDLDGFGSFEHDKYVETGLLASAKGNPIISGFLEQYANLRFFNGLTFDMTPNVIRFTKYMQSLGFKMTNKKQCLNGFVLFPQQLLCGKDWQLGRYDDESTFAVHDYTGTWNSNINAINFYIKNAVTIVQYFLNKYIATR